MATRTWVSGVGDDANPCSRTAPCKTFAGAISKTAAGGEIDVIDPGGFGAVTITKGMTIDGGEGSGFASILASGTTGIIINAGVNDIVTIRNVSINGAGTGIAGVRILAAKAVFIENCEIFGFLANSGGDAGRGIRDARTAGGTLFVSGTTIRNNAQSAIVVLPATGSTRITATIDNCWLQGNGNAGLSAQSGCLVTLTNSIITGNAIGVDVEQAAGITQCHIGACVIAHNGTGIRLPTGQPTVRLTESTITGNNVGVQVSGGALATYGTNSLAGNNSANGPIGPLIPPQ